jgi:hypothetical protein
MSENKELKTRSKRSEKSEASLDTRLSILDSRHKHPALSLVLTF